MAKGNANYLSWHFTACNGILPFSWYTFNQVPWGHGCDFHNHAYSSSSTKCVTSKVTIQTLLNQKHSFWSIPINIFPQPNEHLQIGFWITSVTFSVLLIKKCKYNPCRVQLTSKLLIEWSTEGFQDIHVHKMLFIMRKMNSHLCVRVSDMLHTWVWSEIYEHVLYVDDNHTKPCSVKL